METMNQYFSYNSDCDVASIFYKLYQDMKIIHSNGMFIPVIDSNHIVYDGEFSFGSMILSNNIDLDRRENILSLTKLFLGTYLSIPSGFRDFSFVDTEWFSQNMNDINSIIISEGYFPDYFNSVLLNGEDSYYNDFVDNQRRAQSLGDTSNVIGYKKVLNNAASKFYQDQADISDDNSIVEKKTAFINYLFYPSIFLSLLLIGFVFYTCFRYLYS